MNIYLINRDPHNHGVELNECKAMVIVAESEEDARLVAVEHHWCEGHRIWEDCYIARVGLAMDSQVRGILLQSVRE